MQEADHILIPLLDGRHALAQVAYMGPEFAILFMTDRMCAPLAPTAPFAEKHILAKVEVDLHNIKEGHWPIIGYESVPLTYDNRNETPENLTLHDPAVIEAFANAINGLYPWDGLPDPEFFKNMLLSPDQRPHRARMSADFPQPADD